MSISDRIALIAIAVMVALGMPVTTVGFRIIPAIVCWIAIAWLLFTTIRAALNPKRSLIFEPVAINAECRNGIDGTIKLLLLTHGIFSNADLGRLYLQRISCDIYKSGWLRRKKIGAFSEGLLTIRDQKRGLALREDDRIPFEGRTTSEEFWISGEYGYQSKKLPKKCFLRLKFQAMGQSIQTIDIPVLPDNPAI